jgi:hypothetical protein
VCGELDPRAGSALLRVRQMQHVTDGSAFPADIVTGFLALVPFVDGDFVLPIVASPEKPGVTDPVIAIRRYGVDVHD